MQASAIQVLAKIKPPTIAQAETIIYDAANAGTTVINQETLFGDEQIGESLYKERATIFDRAIKALKKDKAVFATLSNEAKRIESAGNVLSGEANTKRAEEDGITIEYIRRSATTKGAVSDALSQAAHAIKHGGNSADVVRQFTDFVKAEVARGAWALSGETRQGEQTTDTTYPPLKEGDDKQNSLFGTVEQETTAQPKQDPEESDAFNRAKEDIRKSEERLKSRCPAAHY